MIHRRDSMRATKSYMKPLDAADNLEYVWNSSIKEIKADKRVTGIIVEDVNDGSTREIALDGIFVAVGRVPNTEIFADQIDLDRVGYIIADETTKTSAAGVFAVGDLRTKPVRQIVTAASDGAVAVKFAEDYINETF